jgi:hypothetical protein
MPVLKKVMPTLLVGDLSRAVDWYSQTRAFAQPISYGPAINGIWTLEFGARGPAASTLAFSAEDR